MDHPMVFLILISNCVAVNIVDLKVPRLVELGAESVVLDCEYTVTSHVGLVVKWFFNGTMGLVYQWIPPQRPQVIGLLKGKVDIGFRVSDNPLHMYRAMKIVKPTTNLSGQYTCVVSTFTEEDRQTKPMLIYSPGKSFNFVQEKRYVFLVTLICSADDLFPRPAMVISSNGVTLSHASMNLTMNIRGLYRITSKVVIHDDEVSSPWEEYVCTLSLPSANFTVSKTTVYYPGLMPTTYTISAEATKPLVKYANNSSRRSLLECHIFVWCLPTVILIYNTIRSQ